MKNKVLKTIRFTSLLLVILLFLPTFSLWAVEAPEGEGVGTAAEVQAQNESLSAALTASMEEESMLFRYVDRASFIEAGHIERVIEDEELNTYVFKNPDGSKTMYFLGEDVKYLNAQGVQQEKRLDLVALDSGYTARSSDVSLALPNAISKGVTLACNGHSVTLTPKPQTLTGGTVSTGSALTGGTGARLTADLEEALIEQALQIAPIGISAGKADYQGVFGAGTTLRYTPTLSGVKEDVILDTYRGQNTFAFTLNTGNLSVFEENGQYFIAESAEAEEKILISETWVYDSADHFEKGTLTVTPVKAGLYLLTVGANVDFLTDESTVYPVYIDPTLTISYGTTGGGYIEDATVYEGDPTNNYGPVSTCVVGKYSYGPGRTAVRLNGLLSSEVYQNIHGVLIDEVNFYMYRKSGATAKISAYALMNEIWAEDEVTWDTLGAHFSNENSPEVTVASNLMILNITNLVFDWKTENAWYPARGAAGFVLISSAEDTVVNQFYSSEISNTSYRPYVTMTYSTNTVKILSPEHPYRAVADNEKVYIQSGETIQLEAAIYPLTETIDWSVNNSSVAGIGSSTGTVTARQNGCVTISAVTVSSGNNIDSIEVWVVPIIPGEYYIETPLLSDRFIEPMNNGALGDSFTTGGLSENEDNSFIVEFVHSGDFGYYTFKKLYPISEDEVSARYLGVNSSTINENLKFFDNCSDSYKRFDITKCYSGFYKIAPQASSSLGRVISANATAPEGSSLTLQNYADNTGFEDEWIFRRVLPRSGSERVIQRQYFNRDSTLSYRVNCYNYALNAVLASDNSTIAPNSLGLSLGDNSEFVNTSDAAYRMLKADGAEYGFYVYPINRYEKCPEGYYKVALFVASITDPTEKEFHFYRQNQNGTWSHKLGAYTSEEGTGVVSLVDAAGKLIINPEECNRNVETDMGIHNLADYPYFMGYYAINPECMFVFSGISA